MPEAVELLRRVLAGGQLTRAEMESFIGDLMDGRVPEVLQAAMLVALSMRGEAASEISGAASAMRQRAERIPHRRPEVVDTCGTGGDGKGTFNISTAAALIAAAAGVPIAKHGNRSVSSRSGSADVLSALGVEIEMSPERAARAIDEIGIAFLFAPRMHPAMRQVMPVRRALGVRTLFNVLGPLTNPAGARRQVLGVFAPELVPTLARALAELESEHALVVHGDDGLDEITLTTTTRAVEVQGGEIRELVIDPREHGFRLVEEGQLAGGTPEENAAALERILAGAAGPLTEISVLNAGAAIWIGGRAPDLASGAETAREVLASGAARRKLEQLRAFGA